ncbi:MAG: hypothetical protein IKM05_00600, partial [Clostridia bacterium]|nr:hypothetical protein [Clostridia bacterium]
AFSLTACDTKEAAPVEKNTTIVGEWKMDLDTLNAFAGVNTDNFGDILYLVEDLSVVIEFTDDAEETAKETTADLVQTGKMLIKVTANGETVVSEEAYTATYEDGNYRVSIGGAEPNFFRIEDGKLTIGAHE